ncbi:unnamed protein product [Candidula unifasciata]|uniref:EF-hand domain-containing protein n=1 Tax=Candidula unifasciata TaxID=100452 RepID=A0A8S3YFT4_9EUPU|nr:unnamed protein product [Candidula unifasciata]
MSYGYVQQGGYGQQALPAGVDPNWLSSVFQSVDRDRSGHISAVELQQALGNGTWAQFNPETVRLMIGMFDRDCSGTVSYEEFAYLWKYIMDWHNCFRTYDRDNSGFIDKHELRAALSSFGYNLSEKFYDILIKKYDRHNISNIAFDNFVQSAAILQTLTNFFRAEDKDQDGWIDIAYDNFLNIIFSLRS